jgi:hypothetical protein
MGLELEGKRSGTRSEARRSTSWTRCFWTTIAAYRMHQIASNQE